MDDAAWRVYHNLPAGRHHRLQERDEAVLRSVFTGGSGWSLLPGAIYNSWFLFALYPYVTELGDPYDKGFFGATLSAWFGYGLTHRIYAYRVLQEKHPQHARHLGIDRMRERAEAALYAEMWLDVLLSDLYFERVAFYLEQPSAGPVNPRWIERIIREQNEDGGWSKSRSLRCFAEAAIARKCTDWVSSAHPTFLAVYALAQYQGRLRDEDRAAAEGLRAGVAADPLQP